MNKMRNRVDTFEILVYIFCLVMLAIGELGMLAWQAAREKAGLFP